MSSRRHVTRTNLLRSSVRPLWLRSGCFRHQLLLPRPYLVLTKPLRLDIQCQRGASVKIGWKYLDDWGLSSLHQHLMTEAPKNQRHVPRRLITDKLRSDSAACRAVMPSVLHCTDQYANNRADRAEASHQPTRQRERQMRCFTSAAQLQRFASVHGIVQNLFRVGRHLLRLAHHRLLRTRAFVEWDAVTCAC